MPPKGRSIALKFSTHCSDAVPVIQSFQVGASQSLVLRQRKQLRESKQLPAANDLPAFCILRGF
jgi:hypothetical protein